MAKQVGPDHTTQTHAALYTLLRRQTMEWNTGTEPAAPEGDELDYALHDGLLGRTFKYSQYARTPREEQVAAS